MATKKATTPAKNAEPKKELFVEATIDRFVNYEGSKVKAIASLNIGGEFAVHGVKVIDSQKGLFVQMPQTSYEKDGKKQYSDQFHPTTHDARTELNDAVLEAYENKLAETAEYGQSEKTEEFVPKM